MFDTNRQTKHRERSRFIFIDKALIQPGTMKVTKAIQVLNM